MQFMKCLPLGDRPGDPGGDHPSVGGLGLLRHHHVDRWHRLRLGHCSHLGKRRETKRCFKAPNWGLLICILVRQMCKKQVWYTQFLSCLISLVHYFFKVIF